jgi:flagellar biosynthesis protein FliP
MEILSPSLLFIVAMVLFSAFAKIFTAFSILGVGLGLRGTGFGMLIAGLSLLLSWVVVQPYLNSDGTIVKAASQTQASDLANLEEKLRPFMEKNVDQQIKSSLDQVTVKINENANVTGDKSQTNAISTLSAAFMISQLKDAFYLGILFLIPFVVIDLVVANVLMLLGVTQMSVAILALPIKVLLFVAVDGWTLVSERLLNTFVGA